MKFANYVLTEKEALKNINVSDITNIDRDNDMVENSPEPSKTIGYCTHNETSKIVFIVSEPDVIYDTQNYDIDN